MSHPRTRLVLESLEVRENPSTLFTETFDALAPPALPTGWTAWSSDGTAAFASSAQGANGTKGLTTSAGSERGAGQGAGERVVAEFRVSVRQVGECDARPQW